MTSESHLQRRLLLAYPTRIPHLRLFRRNVVVADHGSRLVRAGIKGQADLYGYFKGGKAIELELKSVIGRLTPEQARWGRFCHSWGVVWLVLRPLEGESVSDTIDRWCSKIRSNSP